VVQKFNVWRLRSCDIILDGKGLVSARGRRSITALVALEERMKESMILQVDSILLCLMRNFRAEVRSASKSG
jgi:hypothetical protein